MMLSAVKLKEGAVELHLSIPVAVWLNAVQMHVIWMKRENAI